MAEGGSGTTGRVFHSKAIKADLSIHRALSLKETAQFRAKENEKEEGCISLPGAHQITVANSHTHQSPRQAVRVLSTLLRLHISLFSLHSLLYSKATQDLDHNISEPWSLCLGQALHLRGREQKMSSKKF